MILPPCCTLTCFWRVLDRCYVALRCVSKIKKLAAQLGLGSVEELEDAMDFLEGIDSEGVEMDDGDLAREARVRSAYMDWCKDFGKESDETRFKQFFSNFLEMEDFSIETGKEMILNEFADFTEAEYVAMQKHQCTS